MKTTLALADDHHLVAQALASLIQKFDDYEILFIAENGRRLIERIQAGTVPDIVMMDLNMPIMNGFEATTWLRAHTPQVKVLILSVRDREEDIVRAVREGAKGYLLKDCHPIELRQALDAIRDKGFYYSDFLSEHLIRNLGPGEDGSFERSNKLNDRETDFIRWACSDLTYVEIADKMCVSPRTVDGYRESVFQKLNVKNRASLAIEAVRRGLYVL